jgi:DNA sulfur modification protein DndC
MQTSLFDAERTTLAYSQKLTIESLQSYLPSYRTVAIAFSGGKDSSATLTYFLHLIESGKVQKPDQVYVLYADTRQELPPLHFAAMALMERATELGCICKVVLPPIEKRFWPYILGRGVTSPNNGTLRWCTRQIKVDPMMAALSDVKAALSQDERLLMITGVRMGESAVRDRRILTSCSKDGGECGQGWFQAMTADRVDTLAPLLHWRVCQVWDWLVEADIEYDFPTWAIADAYGMSETIANGDEPINARTGCIACPLISGGDSALTRIVQNPNWAYLAPLHKISRIHEQAKNRGNRLRKKSGELNKNGKISKKQGRYGPIKLDVRRKLLDELLAIQNEVNDAAILQGKPQISLVNDEELAFITQAIDQGLMPQKWDGTEPSGEELIPEPLADGSIQNILWN